MTYRYDIENDIEFDVGMKMTYVHVLMNITMSHGPCDFLTHVKGGLDDVVTNRSKISVSAVHN